MFDTTPWLSEHGGVTSLWTETGPERACLSDALNRWPSGALASKALGALDAADRN